MPDHFPSAISFVLSNETYIRKGQVVSLYEDAQTMECSNWGISLKWFRGINPQATAADIKALTKEGATWLYRQYFWEPSHLDRIASELIACKVLDAEVNQGPSNGVRLLQRALVCIADGILGPMTAAACNTAPEGDLYNKFAAQAAIRYEDIHAAHVLRYGIEKADAELRQWMDRLAKRPTAATTTA